MRKDKSPTNIFKQKRLNQQSFNGNNSDLIKSSTGERKTRRERKDRAAAAAATLLSSMTHSNKGLNDEINTRMQKN